MEMSSAKWLYELGIEDPSCFLQDEYQMESCISLNPNYDHHLQQPMMMNQPSLSSSQLISLASSSGSAPLSSHQLYDQDQCTFSDPKMEMGSMNIGNMDNFAPMTYQDCSYGVKLGEQGTKRSVGPSRSPLQAQDHVLAERKRREKLNERFIALSAIVPGLKKTDKASVLQDAIKYLKQLQERVKTLEEQTTKKSMESVIFVKRSRLCSNDETRVSSDHESFTSQMSQLLPEIEVRVSEQDVLIRIHCEKQKGCIVRMLREVEKLNLALINSSVLPFGKFALDVAIVAKMEDGMCMQAKELARNLRASLP